ncbi:hypothetical protein BKA70DRAFT_1229986 [Coprinopsis sp. MPI-PUGE-AT-0042]|nr:hypothetical protein BKA70DRAFT_1229986 [Coprinopsis sp. MPI-PUGE-AT-0042]
MCGFDPIKPSLTRNPGIPDQFDATRFCLDRIWPEYVTALLNPPACRAGEGEIVDQICRQVVEGPVMPRTPMSGITPRTAALAGGAFGGSFVALSHFGGTEERVGWYHKS